ncbi:putative membrane protein [Mycobacterium sp. MAC_080597_8934]|nr:putative membrane protein [Mycobacterium sp. MAC_080597_8934]
MLVAVTATAIGYGIDAGHKELTHVFAGFYIAGCVAAVLAVRQDGIFTTIIQPPLILFCAVPGAYWLFHDAKVGRLKDLLINCGYPLIERFPLMLGTAGAVLAIGLVRWYFGHGQRSTTAAGSDDAAAGPSVDIQSLVGGLVAKVRAALHPDSDGDTTEESAQRRRTRRSGSSSRTRRTARSTRSSASSSRTRSRHARRRWTTPPNRPNARTAAARRRRSAAARNYDTAGRNYDAAEPPRRTRRRPARRRPELRGQPPREPRREPRPGAVPTNGPCRAAAVSTATTRRAGRRTWAATTPPSRRMSPGAAAPRRPAPTGRITPSRRSATAAPPRRASRENRTPSAAPVRGRRAGRRVGRRRSPGSTTPDVSLRRSAR